MLLEKPPRASPVSSLPRQRSRRSVPAASCSALPRGSHVVQSRAKRFGLCVASSPQSSASPSSPSRSSSSSSLLVPKASSSSSRGDREEGAHSLPAYIHPPIPVEATVTHPHYHRDKKKKNGPSSAPPEMMKNAHRPILFLLYAAAATALASALPSTAAAVSLLSTVWLSFVLAISFTEAWVKFRAPTLTKPAAVDAGRHVFAALNSAEAGLAAGLVAALSSSSSSSPLLDAWRRIAAAPLAALALQVGCLPPSLDRRARELIVSSWRKKKKKETRNEEDDEEDKQKEERARAAVLEMEARDAGTPVPPAWLHAVYIALEAVKVVALALLVKSAGRSAFVF